jgi:UDP-glucose 4-epimerase
MLKNAHVLITGGAGFIGSNLARRLLDEGNRVTLLDNMRRNAMDHILSKHIGQFQTIVADVTDAQQVSTALESVRPSHVVHAAGIAGIDTVAKSPVETISVNFIGTSNVLAAAHALGGVERVVCMSTSEIFGSAAFRPNEATPASVGAVGEPRWVYAVSKLGAEHMAYAYFCQHGLKTVSLRPFNVYGPGQVGEGAMSAFVAQAIQDKVITLHNDGTQIRSWCFIDDMVAGTLAALTSDEAVGRAFNIGNPRASATMFSLAELVTDTLASKSEIVFADRAGADVALRIPDIDYSTKHLGFKPLVDLREGILRTAADYRSRLP